MPGMLVAAATLWFMFSLWIAAPWVGVSPAIERTAAGLFAVELVTLLAWSYGTEGCDGGACGPLTRAAGTAARIDVPVLAALLLVAALLRLRRPRTERRP
jgi:hypothetical protein